MSLEGMVNMNHQAIIGLFVLIIVLLCYIAVLHWNIKKLWNELLILYREKK